VVRIHKHPLGLGEGAVMLQAVLKPLRRRRALQALAHYAKAKDAYRRAVVAGDTRKQAETLPALNAAMIARLRAEVALGIEQ